MKIFDVHFHEFYMQVPLGLKFIAFVALEEWGKRPAVDIHSWLNLIARDPPKDNFLYRLILFLRSVLFSLLSLVV